MSLRLNDIFQLPEAALAGDKRIPKAMLVSQAALTKHEQKTLDKVKRLEHFATVQKSTTRIPACVNDERDIQGIIFLRCEMAGASEAYAEVAHLLHKCFPNPTVICFDNGDEACISVSTTRRSLAEKGAVVIDEVSSTGQIRLSSEAYRPFFDSIAFGALNQEDLLGLLKDLSWNVTLSRSVGSLGFFPLCRPSLRGRLEKLIRRNDDLKSTIEDLESQRRDKDITLNEQAKLRMQVKQVKKECDKVAQEIKEICNG